MIANGPLGVLTHFFLLLPNMQKQMKTNDIIATLIVIITHSGYNMAKVNIFAEKHYEIPMIQAIESKIRKRRLEYGRLISNYGHYFSITVTT
nr:PREDICTED: uncharacterized protein LOC105678325 isoform X2 [Linepithema humile]